MPAQVLRSAVVGAGLTAKAVASAMQSQRMALAHCALSMFDPQVALVPNGVCKVIDQEDSTLSEVWFCSVKTERGRREVVCRKHP